MPSSAPNDVNPCQLEVADSVRGTLRANRSKCVAWILAGFDTRQCSRTKMSTLRQHTACLASPRTRNSLSLNEKQRAALWPKTCLLSRLDEYSSLSSRATCIFGKG